MKHLNLEKKDESSSIDNQETDSNEFKSFQESFNKKTEVPSMDEALANASIDQGKKSKDSILYRNKLTSNSLAHLYKDELNKQENRHWYENDINDFPIFDD